MSTRMVCDICGRGIDGDSWVRLTTCTIDSHGAMPSTNYDLCTARNGNDVGCAQFIGLGLRAMTEAAHDAADQRHVSLPIARRR